MDARGALIWLIVYLTGLLCCGLLTWALLPQIDWTDNSPWHAECKNDGKTACSYVICDGNNYSSCGNKPVHDWTPSCRNHCWSNESFPLTGEIDLMSSTFGFVYLERTFTTNTNGTATITLSNVTCSTPCGEILTRIDGTDVGDSIPCHQAIHFHPITYNVTIGSGKHDLLIGAQVTTDCFLNISMDVPFLNVHGSISTWWILLLVTYFMWGLLLAIFIRARWQATRKNIEIYLND